MKDAADMKGAADMKDAAAVILQVGSWTQLGAAARIVRTTVFVHEQNIPETLEWDEWDEPSLHCVAFVAGEPIATGRLLPDAHIGRMAVLAPWRGGGVGGAVLGKLIERGAGVRTSRAGPRTRVLQAPRVRRDRCTLRGCGHHASDDATPVRSRQRRLNR